MRENYVDYIELDYPQLSVKQYWDISYNGIENLIYNY